LPQPATPEFPQMNESIKFEERLIGDGYKYTIGVSAVDLTRTGSLDLVSTDTDVGLYWYENDGNGNFTKHVVHERSNEWLERHATATRHVQSQVRGAARRPCAH